MARVCQVTGKAPMVGNNVSHANNKTKRRFLPNLQRRRFWVEGENRWISLRLTTNALRTIDKNGIDVVLAELRASGPDRSNVRSRNPIMPAKRSSSNRRPAPATSTRRRRTRSSCRRRWRSRSSIPSRASTSCTRKRSSNRLRDGQQKPANRRAFFILATLRTTRSASELERKLLQRRDARGLGAVAPVLQAGQQLLGRLGRALPQRGQVLAHRVDRSPAPCSSRAPRRA